MCISKCSDLKSKLNIVNLLGRKTVYFSFVCRHVRYDQMGKIALLRVKTGLNETMLRLAEKSNLKFVTPDCKLPKLLDSHSGLLRSS